jgi:hypothetical protein
MNAVSPIELDPLEIEPRPCGLCGCTIDRHERIDGDEGPLFFCLPPDEMDLDELERRGELIRQVEAAAMVERMECADPRDRWRHTGEPPPTIEVRNAPIEAAQRRAPEPYRPAQSTVTAFRLLIKTGDAARARAWLADRPKDAPYLLLLLEG